jgi:hypothetical protein
MGSFGHRALYQRTQLEGGRNGSRGNANFFHGERPFPLSPISPGPALDPEGLCLPQNPPRPPQWPYNPAGFCHRRVPGRNRSGWYATAGFAKTVERAGAAAGLALKAHPHMLRHACGFALANAGHEGSPSRRSGRPGARRRAGGSRLAPTIAELRASGVTSLRRGVRTPRGVGEWQAGTVAQLLARMP